MRNMFLWRYEFLVLGIIWLRRNWPEFRRIESTFCT